MCGIVAAIAKHDVVSILIEGLFRLEYRGYDSAGVAVLDADQTLQYARSVGKVAALSEQVKQRPDICGSSGIAHTRWATHGVPSEANCHPLLSHGQVALVHNGIIENHRLLRTQLEADGYRFESATDTEVIAHLLHFHWQRSRDLLLAMRAAIAQLEGAYAIGALHCSEPGRIVGARFGSPLVVGIGVDAHYFASDATALTALTQQFIALEDGDIVDLRRTAAVIEDGDGNPVERPRFISESASASITRGNYLHFMEKEIHEQPQAIYATLEGRVTNARVMDQAFGLSAAEVFDQVQSVQIIACGTSYFAGLVARNWFEGLARIPCRVEVASEFRYRHPIPSKDCLLIVISQSGETADTLGALRMAKALGYGPALGIVNVPQSSVVRECDLVLMTRAGPEIGVASTKAFTTQLTALLMLVCALGRRHGIKPEREQTIVEQLRSLPRIISQALALEPAVIELSARFANKQHALFLGRGVQYPVAMEGALKLKEISYIHAEAYPAGELKHGPLALIDADMPVVAVAPNDELLGKLESNLEEVRARGGELYVFAGKGANVGGAADGIHVINMPEVGGAVAPLVYVIPLQLLAYHVARLKGTDIDQPRNLAKSVTVE